MTVAPDLEADPGAGRYCTWPQRLPLTLMRRCHVENTAFHVRPPSDRSGLVSNPSRGANARARCRPTGQRGLARGSMRVAGADPFRRQTTLTKQGDGSRPNIASVLQEGEKSANVHVRSGVIWRIPAKFGPDRRCFQQLGSDLGKGTAHGRRASEVQSRRGSSRSRLP